MMPNPPQSVSLDLAKFSYATTTADRPGPMAWTHVNSNGDLHCTLDKFEESLSAPSRLILRVIQQKNVLEQIDLAYWVRINRPSASQNELSQKPTFAVVVKSPCLAVKYPQGGSRIRRLQIKFCLDSDYYKALAVLSEIKCPLTEGNTATQAPRRALSSSSWTSAPVSVSTTKNINAAKPSMVTAPMSECTPYGMTTLNPPSPSSTSTYNMVPIVGRRSPDLRTLRHNPSSVNLQSDPPFPSSQIKHTVSQIPNARSATAPTYYDENKLNQMLPPKRQLPFAKPSQKRIRTNSSQPDMAPSMSQTTTVDQIFEPPSSQIRNPLTRRDNLERCDSIQSDSQSQSLVPTQPYPDAADTAPASPEPPSTQPYPFSTAVNEFQVPGSTLRALNRPVGPNEARVQQTQPAAGAVEDNLALYLASPTPERVAFLENWMCELIEDDKFMQLCQDVEGTWRRFAFGIKK